MFCAYYSTSGILDALAYDAPAKVKFTSQNINKDWKAFYQEGSKQALQTKVQRRDLLGMTLACTGLPRRVMFVFSQTRPEIRGEAEQQVQRRADKIASLFKGEGDGSDIDFY